MFRRALNILLTLFNVAFAIMALYFIFKGGAVTPESGALDYKDFIAILLTALGVMIALGALLIAMLAIWTYKNAMELITDAAATAAREHVTLLLPDFIDDAMRFAEEGGEEEADEIATAYSKEGEERG